jgi:hypothetical protein
MSKINITTTGDIAFQSWKDEYFGTKVFLNGVEMKYVHTADDIKDIVVVSKLNEQGFPYADGDKIATQTFYGKVLIILPDACHKLRRNNDSV